MNLNLSIDFTSLSFWAGVPSALFLLRYAYQVFTRQAPATGLATFLMWSILDCLLLINTIRNGQPIWLPFGWVVGATTATIVLLIRGEWIWTWRETLSLVCATLAAIASIIFSGRGGLIATIFAMLAAGMPILIDNLKVPVRATFMLWFVTAVGCILSICGSDGSIDGTMLPISSLLYNGFMAYIVLRKPKAALAAT